MKNYLPALAFASALTLTSQAAPSDKSPAANAPAKTVAAEKAVPKSAFGLPAKPSDGHDPFFPVSDRLFAVKTTPKSSTSTFSSAIVFNGISGSEDRRFAMINGHTFAEGEKASVNTTGGRVPVLLVAIKGDVAIVEIAGERRELTFPGH